jgi:gliding motility associated protien GldN
MNIRFSYKNIIPAALLFVNATAFAQDPAQTPSHDAVNASWQKSLVPDGVYDYIPRKAAPLAWQPIREADVMWKKRVWREIDVNERANLPFRYSGDDLTGGGYFIEILLDAIKKGKVKAYSQFDDRFTTEMSSQQIMELLAGKTDSTRVIDPMTGEESITVTHREFDPEQVVKYRIKEDVIFDRNVGRMVTRIIGIAPITNVMDPNSGEIRGNAVLFWLYYPEARKELAKYEVYNPENDVARLNWDDFFEGRFFSSRIIKVSNPYNDLLPQGMDGLNEGQRLTEQFVNKEMEMWVY